MNFQTILEELNKFYEEPEVDVDSEGQPVENADGSDVSVKLQEPAVTEACGKPLKEATEDEEVLIDDEPIVDDEAEAEAEAVQVVLECAKCGALMIKPETEAEVDEKTDLVTFDEACQYCESTEGYRIIGAFTPYATEENTLEEGIFSKRAEKTIPAGTVKPGDHLISAKEFDLEYFSQNGKPCVITKVIPVAGDKVTLAFTSGTSTDKVTVSKFEDVTVETKNKKISFPAEQEKFLKAKDLQKGDIFLYSAETYPKDAFFNDQATWKVLKISQQNQSPNINIEISDGITKRTVRLPSRELVKVFTTRDVKSHEFDEFDDFDKPF